MFLEPSEMLKFNKGGQEVVLYMSALFYIILKTTFIFRHIHIMIFYMSIDEITNQIGRLLPGVNTSC